MKTPSQLFDTPSKAFLDATRCCDGECNHDDCCGKIPENCTHKESPVSQSVDGLKVRYLVTESTLIFKKGQFVPRHVALDGRTVKTEEIISLADAKSLLSTLVKERWEETVNRFIKKWCSVEYIPHLLDSDENDGQELRDILLTLRLSAYEEGRKEEREEVRKWAEESKDTFLFASGARLKANTKYNEALTDLITHLNNKPL
jgi:hypothetical protein